MNAQVSFLDTSLSLIHIPLHLYGSLLQPILKVLLPESQTPNHLLNHSPSSSSQSSPTNGSHHHSHDHHPFINISVTPIECSIVCPTSWASKLFADRAAAPTTTSKTLAPLLPFLSNKETEAAAAAGVSISKDTYSALCVTSAGMDAGSRVADLTSPLALANIPIFFITTYYSDFILVPTKDRQVVVKTLLAGGFVFEHGEEGRREIGGGYEGGGDSAGVSAGGPGGRKVSLVSEGQAQCQGGQGLDGGPPSSVSELQERTFELLKKRGVVPYVEEGLRLVQCSGRERSAVMRGASYSDGRRSRHGSNGKGGARSGGGAGGAAGSSMAIMCWVDTVDTKLYTSVVSALVSQPRFLSITLAQEDPPSLLMDRELLGMFGDSVVGPTEGALVPIFLDLADLPFEATGIVSGVAGRLVKDMRMEQSAELSYLSTARAGAVILSSEESVMALDVLRPLLTRDEQEEETQ